MERMNYQTKGLSTLKGLINDVNIMLRNVGTVPSDLQTKLDAEFERLGVMHPKDNLLLYHLDTKRSKSGLTDEEKVTRQSLIEKANKARTYFKEHCDLATMKETLKERGLSVRLRVQQKKDFRGNTINISLIPPLWFFQRLDGDLPVSIIGAQWAEFNLEVTNEPAMKVGLLSVSYNNVSNQYELHNWITTYVLETSDIIDFVDENDEDELM